MGAVPEFEVVSDERQSWVHGRVGGVEVTRASFKECEEPFRRELIQIDTPPEHQRQGYALALLRYLESVEPAGPLIDSPAEMNSEAGIATVAAARLTGVAIHDFGCYRNAVACDCVLSVQSS
mgnify:CR=1 FL=1